LAGCKSAEGIQEQDQKAKNKREGPKGTKPTQKNEKKNLTFIYQKRETTTIEVREEKGWGFDGCLEVVFENKEEI